MPGLGPVDVPQESIERREPAADRQQQFDQRLEERRPATETRPGHRVVGGPLLIGESEFPFEIVGYVVPVCAYTIDLTRREPQTHRGLRREGGDEKLSQPEQRARPSRRGSSG